MLVMGHVYLWRGGGKEGPRMGCGSGGFLGWGRVGDRFGRNFNDTKETILLNCWFLLFICHFYNNINFYFWITWQTKFTTRLVYYPIEDLCEYEENYQIANRHRLNHGDTSSAIQKDRLIGTVNKFYSIWNVIRINKIVLCFIKYLSFLRSKRFCQF